MRRSSEHLPVAAIAIRVPSRPYSHVIAEPRKKKLPSEPLAGRPEVASRRRGAVSVTPVPSAYSRQAPGLFVACNSLQVGSRAKSLIVAPQLLAAALGVSVDELRGQTLVCMAINEQIGT
jgi:hypothetical protein